MTIPAKLFSPGPTPLSEETLAALGAPPLHHRSEAFKKILKDAYQNLSLIFDEEHIVAFSSTGTGALEASVTNFLSTADSVLYLDGGKFGERWGEILTAFKIKNYAYKFDWGTEPETQKIKELLIQKKPAALCMQACETSTATMYNIKEVSELIKEHSPETLLIVDGVTAVGAYELSMKENSIDVLITGSQKALGLPVGLSLIGFSKNAKEKAKKSDIPKYYFNVVKELQNLKKEQTWFSSPTQIWMALHNELKKLKQSGLKTKYQNNLRLQKQILEWAKKNSIKLFSKSPSPSLTALLLPKDIKASALQKKMLDEGYYIATGQNNFKETIIRIGHMANITQDEMTIFLETLQRNINLLQKL